LSVVCRELNSKRLAAQPPLQRITADLMRGADRKILKGFYERGMEGLDPRVGIFVEEELITQQGFRDSRDWEDAQAKPGVTSDALEQLVRRRLLRADERQGRRRLELTHDVLAKVVMESRDQRRADARAKQQEEELRRAAQERQREEVLRKKKDRLLMLGIAGSVGLACIMAFLSFQADKQKKEAQSQVARTWAAVSEGLMRDHQVDPELSIEFALAALNRADKLEPFATTKLIVNLVNAIHLYGRHSISRGEGQVANWSLATIANNKLISAGDHGSFKIWTLNLDSPDSPVKANLDSPIFLRLTNGNIIAGGVLAKDDTIAKAGSVRLQLWNSDVSKKLKEKDPRLPGIKFIKQLSSNGDLVIVDMLGQPWLWKQDLSNNPIPLKFNSDIKSLTVLSPRDEILVSVQDGKNFSLQLWSANLRKPIATAILNDEVTSLIQLNDDKFVSGSKSGSLQLWDSNLKQIGPSIEAQSRDILSLAQLDSGELISGSADGTLRRWRVSKDGLSAFHLPFPANQSKVNTLLDLQSSLISGGSNGLIKKWVWEKDSSANNASIRTGEGNVVMVTPLGDGMVYRLATSSTPKEYLLKYGSARKKLAELTETRLEGQVSSPILSLLLLKDGDLATGHEDGSIQRWKYNPKGKVWVRQGRAFPVAQTYNTSGQPNLNSILSMAQLGKDYVVLGGADGRMRRIRINGEGWNEKNKELCMAKFNENQKKLAGVPITSLAILADGDLVSGGRDGTIVRWNSPLHQWCRDFAIIPGNEGPEIFSMTELSDGTMMNATDDGGLVIWKWKWKWNTLWPIKDEPAAIYWKGPGQQIASVANLPNQKGFVVADFTGRSKIYPDRETAIELGCNALLQKFMEEKNHENMGNQVRRPYENEARDVCRRFINENTKTLVGKN
jgi:WD40 repeat protein